MKVSLNDFEHMTRITVSREKYTNKRKKTFEGSTLKFKRFVAKEYMQVIKRITVTDLSARP